MVQRKKEDVRDAILAAAFRLFSEQGYSETSLPAIAREAGISTSNVYVYFNSKIDVLFTLYAPWLEERLDKLERSLRRVPDPQQRVARLLLALWRDFPRESNGFANNVIQAVSISNASGDYSPELRENFQRRVKRLIESCLDAPPGECDMIAGVALMAFDGFAMNVRLAHGVACNVEIANLFSRMLVASNGSGRPAQIAKGRAPAPGKDARQVRPPS